MRTAGSFLVLVIAGSLAAEPCPVTLVAKGVNATPGSVGFVVFASADGWPEDYEKAIRREAAPARSGDIAVTLPDLPPGRYAIALVHDENGNRRLDRRPSGRPREGWGMSNNPKPVLRTPGFAAAAVTLACGARLEILVQYPAAKSPAP